MQDFLTRTAARARTAARTVARTRTIARTVARTRTMAKTSASVPAVPPARTRAANKVLACALAALLVVPLAAGCSAGLRQDALNGIAGDVKTDGLAAMEDCGTQNSYVVMCCPDTQDVLLVEPNTEEYAALQEHGYVSVATDPFSTFSADVDTASYCNLRRMIRNGYSLGSIPDGAVRIEEMLNYFSYSYPEAPAGKLFGVSAQIADCPWNPDTKLLVMGLRAKQDTGAVSAGNNLVFLIDTSGSMDSPDKLDLLKGSFACLLDELAPQDTVSVVTYSGEERVVLDGVSASQKERILRAIKSLRAEGCTNGQAGLSMAYELAQQHFIQGGNNRIVLASDGDLNVGITSESDLSSYVASMRDAGVFLSVLGFGDGNYKDTKMETIADDGNGAYYYIDCPDEARRVFHENLQSTLYTVAQDVKLQLEFNPAYVKGYRQIGYENRALSTDDFQNDTVDAGEVGAGSVVTVAYELVMKDSPLKLTTAGSRYGNTVGEETETAAGSEAAANTNTKNGSANAANATADSAGATANAHNNEWLVLNVRYKEPGSTAQDAAAQEIYPVTSAAYTNNPSQDWRFASCVIGFGLLANNSSYAGTLTATSLEKSIAALDMKDERRAEFGQLATQALADPCYDGTLTKDSSQPPMVIQAE